ncbi:MAG: RNA methyltransferase [Opitutae bacterium]|nr:RNA methyltransferase [Opitutae bacterium]
MNLILFTPADLGRPLPRSDPRARHLLGVLRRGPGDQFDCGLVNGPRGKGTLVAADAAALTLTFAWGEAPAPADPITLVVGLPRPQTARDVLRDATTLGVAALHFVLTEKTDPGYAQSTLWHSGEWHRHVRAGAEQAFDTRVPAVTHGLSLAAALAALPPCGTRLALDPYEAAAPLAQCHIISDASVVLALGPERGWGAADRALLREHGFALVHLGARVLRTETAVAAALTLVKAARGSL